MKRIFWMTMLVLGLLSISHLSFADDGTELATEPSDELIGASSIPFLRPESPSLTSDSSDDMYIRAVCPATGTKKNQTVRQQLCGWGQDKAEALADLKKQKPCTKSPGPLDYGIHIICDRCKNDPDFRCQPLFSANSCQLISQGSLPPHPCTATGGGSHNVVCCRTDTVKINFSYGCSGRICGSTPASTNSVKSSMDVGAGATTTSY